MANTDQVVVDALGDPIEIGKKYGYSAGASGRVRTVVGTAANITSTGKVTLDDLIVKQFLYGKPIDVSWEPAPKVSIRAFQVFPVTK